MLYFVDYFKHLKKTINKTDANKLCQFAVKLKLNDKLIKKRNHFYKSMQINYKKKAVLDSIREIYA